MLDYFIVEAGLAYYMIGSNVQMLAEIQDVEVVKKRENRQRVYQKLN